MKKITIILAFLVIPFTYLAAQSSVKDISEKSRLSREDILKKDMERRARILKKFSDFQQRVKNFVPDMKVNIPVNPDRADDINELDSSSEITKQKAYYAFTADSYNLRSLPYDSVREYTATVRRGDRVSVLMKPDVKKDKKYPSITKDWMLIKTGDGSEGYIPQNMLLGKKPSSKDRSSLLDPGNNLYPVGDLFSYGTEGDDNEIRLVLTQYAVGGDTENQTKMFKVNAAALNVRADPSLNSETTYTLNRGDRVEVLEYSEHEDYYAGNYSKWAKIRYENITGWVFAYYLVEAGNGTEEGGTGSDFTSYLSKGKSLYVKSDILRVRDAPDDYGTVLFSLQNKDRVEIVDMENEEVTLGGKKSKWVKVKYLDYDGWVFGAFLSDNRNAFEEGDDINNIFQVPIDDGYFISSKFGKRVLKGKVSNHTGIDLAAPCGTTVVAAADGVVILIVDNPRNCTSCGYGSYVIIEHKNGYRSVYGHLSKIYVKNGQKLNSGEKVGAVGNTGHSYGCHLHFEIRAYEEFVDPMNYIHP